MKLHHVKLLQIVLFLVIAANHAALGMNKAELIDAVAAESPDEATSEQVHVVLNEFFELWARALKICCRGHGGNKKDKKRAPGLGGGTGSGMGTLATRDELHFQHLGTFSLSSSDGLDDDCNSVWDDILFDFEVVDDALVDVYPIYVENYWFEIAMILPSILEIIALHKDNDKEGSNPLYNKARARAKATGILLDNVATFLSERDPSEILGEPEEMKAYCEYQIGYWDKVATEFAARLDGAQAQAVLQFLNAAPLALEEGVKRRRNRASADASSRENDLPILLQAVETKVKSDSITMDLIEVIVAAAFAIIIKEVGKKGRVCLGEGIGTFALEDRPVRTGRNPQTGKEIKVAVKKVAKFKAGKALADTVK